MDEAPINLDQPCPCCNGSTFDPRNQEDDCPICLGLGDLGAAAAQVIENFTKSTMPKNHFLIQFVAQRLINDSERILEVG